MAPRVLYFCPCALASELASSEHGDVEAEAGPSSSHLLSPTIEVQPDENKPVASSSSSQRQQPAVIDAIPPLPCFDKAARYSHYALEELYYCEECEQIKCKRCTTSEVSAYFCPICLFDVQPANVKADRNRCSRSCFCCPLCSHSLQVVATDPSHGRDRRTPEASVGEPPYFLSCTACKWDSKEIGMTFEKPTGLSLQLQRAEEQSHDILEYDHLIEHFDAYYKTQSVAQTSSAPTAGLSSRHQAALSAAAKSSKLLRDVPILQSQSAHSRYVLGKPSRYKQKEQARIPPDEIADYRTITSYNSGRSVDENGKAGTATLGIVGRKEDFKRRWLSQNTTFANTATLAQKWANSWEQPVRTKDLYPLRAELSTKLTKRCTDCSHILIRPDVKSATTRYKIKLVAMTFLPAIEVALSSAQGSADGDRLSKRTSMMSLYGTRRQHSLLGQSSASSGASAGTNSPHFTDAERLSPGRAYAFECTFTNPLEDPMKVRISIVKPVLPSGTDDPQSNNSPAAWQVVPSTSQFTVAAASVLNMDDEEDLLGDSSRRGGDADDGADDDVLDERDEDELSDGDEDEDGRRKAGRLSGFSGRRARRTAGARSGVLRKRGNTTTIGLEAVLDGTAKGDIEVAMRVTFRYEGEEADTGKDGEGSKSFTFWTAVRLGYCVPREATSRPSARDNARMTLPSFDESEVTKATITSSAGSEELAIETSAP